MGVQWTRQRYVKLKQRCVNELVWTHVNEYGDTFV